MTTRATSRRGCAHVRFKSSTRHQGTAPGAQGIMPRHPRGDSRRETVLRVPMGALEVESRAPTGAAAMPQDAEQLSPDPGLRRFSRRELWICASVWSLTLGEWSSGWRSGATTRER